jgi:hypothetical protein
MHLPTKPRDICSSGLTMPSVHTVVATATSGAVVVARATDQYVTLPPA